MTLLPLAEFEMKHLVYLFFFAFWIVGQYAESQKKKKKKAELEAAERTGRPAPEQTSAAPLDNDLKKLLEQLTGVPASAPPPAPRPRPMAPPPPLPSNASMEQVRAQSQRLKQQLRKAHAQRAAPKPPQRRETYEVATAPTSAPISSVAPASISVSMRSQNVELPQMKITQLRSAPSSPMRPTADAQRLAWIKNPSTLRQLMTARFVLDPPKALEAEAR